MCDLQERNTDSPTLAHETFESVKLLPTRGEARLGVPRPVFEHAGGLILRTRYCLLVFSQHSVEIRCAYAMELTPSCMAQLLNFDCE